MYLGLTPWNNMVLEGVELDVSRPHTPEKHCLVSVGVVFATP